MSDPDKGNAVNAFATCADCLEVLIPESRARVLSALIAFFSKSGPAPAESVFSDAERSVLQGMIPFCPTRYK